MLTEKQTKHLKRLTKLNKGVPKTKSHRINQSNSLKGRFIGKNNFNYKDGRTNKTYHCPICNKILSSYQAKMCVSCARKLQIRTPKGRNFPKCIDCGKKLSHYKSKRCRTCFGVTQKKLWQNDEYKQKRLSSMFKGFNLNPNKPEKALQQMLIALFYKEYKFVGTGDRFVGGFCPDFININGQKKIIELFGDYWHNREDAKKRDKLRLKSYKRYGYKTLIIWEHELKNPENLIIKLKDFHNAS